MNENDRGSAQALRELSDLRLGLLEADLRFEAPYTGPLLPQAVSAMARINELIHTPAINRFCEVQLRILEANFESYTMTNARLEEQETRCDRTDFSMVAKVDTHLHLSALMTSKELFDFIGEIYERDGDDKYDEEKTIRQLLEESGYVPDQCSIDNLCTHAVSDVYRDFDAFNKHFLPFRSKQLADMMFKIQPLGGKYLREIVARVAGRAKQQNVYLEPRVSIYARKYGEWEELAEWFDRSRARVAQPNVLWAVQCPRVFHVWRKMGALANFGALLRNFFGPLFDATLAPEAHPKLAFLLSRIGCIDTVDNEALEDSWDCTALPPPDEYTAAANPPYSYWHHYFWANLRALNRLRVIRGLNMLRLRPHAGEAGPLHHLATTFLFAHGISHGILLKAQPVLQYLYYLNMIGISVSPISNACLFVPYAKNPFARLFARGLRVTLTTDDPLQFHVTEQPQLEEYATAKHAWGLSMTDLSEIARNSVLISSAPPALREELIGGDDPCDRCNVPRRRFDFRHRELCRNFEDVGIRWPPMHPLQSVGFHLFNPQHTVDVRGAQLAELELAEAAPPTSNGDQAHLSKGGASSTST